MKYKQFDAVIVHWNDAWKNSRAKFTTEEAIEFGSRTCTSHTAGFIVDKNDDRIILTQHYNDQDSGDKLCSDVLNIPMSLVTQIEKFVKTKKSKK